MQDAVLHAEGRERCHMVSVQGSEDWGTEDVLLPSQHRAEVSARSGPECGVPSGPPFFFFSIHFSFLFTRVTRKVCPSLNAPSSSSCPLCPEPWRTGTVRDFPSINDAYRVPGTQQAWGTYLLNECARVRLGRLVASGAAASSCTGPSTPQVNGDLGFQSPEGADVFLASPKVKPSFETKTFPLRPGRRHAQCKPGGPSRRGSKKFWSSQLCKFSRGAYASLTWYRPCPHGHVPAAVSLRPCWGRRRHRPTAPKAAVLFFPIVCELMFVTIFWVSDRSHPQTP